MILLISVILIVGGAYAFLLGLAKVPGRAAWRGKEECLWIGRFAVFFGILFFLDGIGITSSQISSWIQDIYTSGGGAGTG